VANGLNKVMLIGNLGSDPTMRYTSSGKAVTTLSVAVSHRRTIAEGETREETEWFRVVLYEKLAEVANQWLSKGRRVYVEGRLQTRSWEGQDGQPHARLEVIASELLFLDGTRQTPAGETPFPSDEEELPF
jgi:single-strand DNA-binding protein